jgi:hypothetical protein
MRFIEMDPELARKAVEGYTDELTPQLKAQDAFYRQFRCKMCGGACQKEHVRGHVFSDPDILVPRSCLRCIDCRCLFDPHSGLLLERGNASLPRSVPRSAHRG